MIPRLLTQTVCALALVMVAVTPVFAESVSRTEHDLLKWTALPDLPNERGVAGAMVGTHNGALIVAGGANFPDPIWETDKVWHDDVWVLTHDDGRELVWLGPFELDRPVAYGATVSVEDGVVCLGGDDGEKTFADAFMLSWDDETNELHQTPLPSMPAPAAYGSATVIGSTVYFAGGLRDEDLEQTMSNFWRLDLSKQEEEDFGWEVLPSWPGPSRAFNLTVAQHNGFDDCVYVISGRRANDADEVADVTGFVANDDIFVLHDVYEFNPRKFGDAGADAQPGDGWRQRADVPWGVMAGTAAAVGQSHVFVLGGADGTLIKDAAELGDDHPGFRRDVLSYHTITDTWIIAGEMPANQVTTEAAPWGDGFVVTSGEVRPRHRTPAVWLVEPDETPLGFGAIDFTVLVAYLLAMVGVGVYFARKNQNTDDYFRSGQRTLWWVAGCSIFATMLSSITYMAIPAKAFAQDIVWLVGNMMILVVAPLAIFVALPFFRRIDATSAYEYLQKRFNMPVRLFASGLFTLFHLFRMGIVMALAALALATITPLSAPQCVLVMGLLSVVYCTLGGVSAVMWTDTIQTFVLLGGGILCLILAVRGAQGGLGEVWQTASADDKLHLFNIGWDATSTSLVLWVVVLGAIGQNVASYTSDQAVVQRYMTTPDSKLAAKSIWAAAIIAIPASFLFYFMGTALYVFYKSNPQKLDPTFMTDQILPLFIAHELPVGIAGLIVAGIFAAAQSTISTSMNSTATTVVTDFMRPFKLVDSERGYLNAARALTLGFGIGGTALGLLFVDPDNRSLFGSFITVIGFFMGVLGGLFMLGMLTQRATARGAVYGALIGTSVVVSVWWFTDIAGYLYAAIGIGVCFVVGYLASLFEPSRKSLDGLTIYTVLPKQESEAWVPTGSPN